MATNFSQLPKTFDDIKAYLLGKINTNYPLLGAIIDNSFLVIFVDVLAYAIEILMDTSSNFFNELHLPTAINYENARIKAQFFGYNALSQKSAEGTMLVGVSEGLDSPPLESVILNQYDRLSISGIDYLVADTTVITTADTSKSVPIIQGRRITVNNIALGRLSEKFTINDANVERSPITVTVDGVEWTEVEDFFESSSTDQVFQVRPLSNFTGFEVIFGNNLTGDSVPINSVVIISYTQTDGLSGQLQSTGIDVTFLEDYSYSSSEEVTLYGSTTSQLINGSNLENIDSIKYFGQLAASSIEDKAFNDDEIKLQLEDYGGILLSKSFSEYDNNPVNPDFTRANRVQLLISLSSGLPLEDADKNGIRVFLRDKMDFTDFIEFLDADYIDVQFRVDMEAKVSSPQDLAAQVDSFLENTYSLGVLDFGKSLNHSEVSQAVSNEFDDYIIRFNLKLNVVEEETDLPIPTGGTVTQTLKLGNLVAGQDNIKTCNVEVVFDTPSETGIEETLTSTAGGSFVLAGGEDSQFLEDGTIDFVTGEVSLDTLPTVVGISTIRYVYETYDVDGIDLNIDVKFDQAIRYKESAGLNSDTITIEFKKE